MMDTADSPDGRPLGPAAEVGAAGTTVAQLSTMVAQLSNRAIVGARGPADAVAADALEMSGRRATFGGDEGEPGEGGAGGAATSNITIFLRVRPVPRPSPRLLLDEADGGVEFNIPRDAVAG